MTEDQIARAVQRGIRQDRQRQHMLGACIFFGIVLGIVGLLASAGLFHNRDVTLIAGAVGFGLPFYFFRRSL